MTSVAVRALLVALLLASTPFSISGQSVEPSNHEKQPATLSRSVQVVGLPLSFELNVGQLPSDVSYISRRPSYSLFFVASDMVLRILNQACSGKPCQSIRFGLLGTNDDPRAQGRRPVSSHSNYLIGNDPRKWRKHIPQFAEVWYPGVYPGVDLVYYGNDGRLEYDFIVSPHANPARIAFSITGLEPISRIRESANGDLVIPIEGHEVVLQGPRIYQGKSCLHEDSKGDSTRGFCRELPGGRFALHHADSGVQVGFEIPPYDHSQTLVIDPVVAFSTFLGGSMGDGVSGMTLDSDGNIYLIGGTNSPDFPVTSGVYQTKMPGTGPMFIAKLSNDGSHLIYSTYLGGSGNEGPNAIAVDSSGNVYVTGYTYSTDFPLVNPYQTHGPAYTNAFVSKLSPDGSSLLYSTYLGGDYETSSNSIAVDSNGEATVVGFTYATDFPAVNAIQPTQPATIGNSNGFVTKFSPDGSSVVFSTYLGGTGPDLAQGVNLDPAGNIYVAGMTESTNFPTTPGAYQTTFVPSYLWSSFVAKFIPSGTSLSYSTYLPASQAFAIAVNSAGNAFVTGNTGLSGFPVTPGAFQTVQGGPYAPDAFVTEFDTTGSSLVYSTFLGGTDYDFGYGIAVDSANNAYVTGQTFSLDFPLQFPVISKTSGSGTDAFVSELNSSGSQLLFSTYLGGGPSDAADSGGQAIAVDGSGNFYASGYTHAPDYPVLNAIQTQLKGPGDSFIVRFLNQPSPTITVAPTSIAFAPQNVSSVSPSQTITVISRGPGLLTLHVTPTSQFAQTNNCSVPLAPNATCAIQATFAPTQFGMNTGQITISSDATLVPQIVQLTGIGQDFTIQGYPQGVTVSAGRTANYSLSLTPEAGFAQQLSFSCAGAPSGSTCAVSPGSLTLDGTHVGTANISVTTIAPSAAGLPFGRVYANGTGSLVYPGTLPLTASFGALLLLIVAITSRRNVRVLSALGVICVGLIFLACGGSSSGTGGGGKGGTSPGTYTVVVSATTVGGLRHSVNLTMNVN